FGDVVALDVCKDGLQGFQVTVNIADDGLHAWISQGCSAVRCAGAAGGPGPGCAVVETSRALPENGFLKCTVPAERVSRGQQTRSRAGGATNAGPRVTIIGRPGKSSPRRAPECSSRFWEWLASGGRE